MLYNKYRPGTFDDVLGQTATIVLRNSIDARKVLHSILMYGTRGTGKTTLARVYAKAVNCTGRGMRPCGECPSCKVKIHPDIIEIDSAQHSGVDAIGRLRERAYLKPSFKYRVMIFDEAHAITGKGMDMLLKLVEEPPAQTIFIFLTTDVDKLNQPLQSRCVKLALSNLSVMVLMRVVAQVCKAEGIGITREAVEAIASNARGSARDALSLLEALGNDEKITGDIVRVASTSVPDATLFVAKAFANDIQRASKELNKLVLYHEPDDICVAVTAEVNRLIIDAACNSQGDAVKALEKMHIIWRATKQRIRYMYSPMVELECAMIESALIQHSAPTSAVVKFDWERFIRRAKGLDGLSTPSIKFVRLQNGKQVVVLAKTIKATNLLYKRKTAVELELTRLMDQPMSLVIK